MTTLLVPVDFEECSERALDVASGLARDLGADLLLMHVVVLPIFPYPDFPPDLMAKMVTETERAGREALEKLAARAGCATILRQGEPASEILRAIEEIRPRMVVMGTHGRGAIKRLVLGSVAERVVRKSPVPVVTVSAAADAQAERVDVRATA